MRVFLLNIEPLEMRYTAQWASWWERDLRRLGVPVIPVDGRARSGRIEAGEFLDVRDTWRWKGSQVEELADVLEKHRLGPEDVVLNLDGWGPATLAAAYVRDLTDAGWKLVTYMHAGSYDPADFLARKGTRRWALDFERSVFRASDAVLVGSEFHKHLAGQHLGLGADDLGRVHVVGAPVHRSAVGEGLPWRMRPKRVVFPHRLAPEKGLKEWAAIKERVRKLVPGAEFMETHAMGLSKADYYTLLGTCRVVVSCAFQETFGIATQEAIAAGCWPVVPDRLAYPEVVRVPGALYQTPAEAARMVVQALSREGRAPWDFHHEECILRAAEVMKEVTRA